MSKIKILYIVSRLVNKGPTNQLHGLISNLNKKKYKPIILTLSGEPENSRIDDFLALNVEFFSLNLHKLTPNFILKKKLVNYIEEIEPDVIQTQGIRADNLVASLNYKNMHCLTLRNYAPVDYREKYGKILGSLMATKTYKTINRCKYIICCAHSINKLYSEDVNKNFYTIQNGVDTNKYKPLENYEQKYNLRKKLGFNKNDILFIVVGSLIPRKDPLTIIRAFNQIKDKNFKLVFLGSGVLMEDCKQLANSNVIFKGSQKNVDEFLKVSDVYISASKSEGLPNSVLEASSIGLDLILSNIDQHKEIFEDLYNKPKYFETENPEQLYKYIVNINTENKSLNNFSLSSEISNNFSSYSMSKKYENMYELITLK